MAEEDAFVQSSYRMPHQPCGGVGVKPYYTGMDFDSKAGMDFEYPPPLFLRDVFGDTRLDHQPSLGGFRHDWLCEADGDPVDVRLSSPYRPGELLARTALLDPEAALAVPRGFADVVSSATSSSDCMSSWLRTAEEEPISQCSTVDTVGEAGDASSIAMAVAVRGMSDDSVSFDASTPAVEFELGVLGALGTKELPTVGSRSHYTDQCKPCAFVYKDGCKSGQSCQFCHLCEPGVKKRRKKEKSQFAKAMRSFQMAYWTNYMRPQL